MKNIIDRGWIWTRLSIKHIKLKEGISMVQPDDNDRMRTPKPKRAKLYYKLSGQFCSLFPRPICEVCNAARSDALAVVTILLSVVWVSNLVVLIMVHLPWMDAFEPLQSAISCLSSLMSSIANSVINLLIIPLELMWYICALLASFFSNIVPTYPDFNIPGWYGDIAVPSILLSRLCKISDEIVPTSQRGGLLRSMPELDQNIIEKTGIPLVRWPWHLIDKLNEIFYWNILMGPLQERFLPQIFGKLAKWLGVGNEIEANIYRNFAYTVGGLLLLGYPKVIGYVLFLVKNKNLNYPVLDNYRRWFISLVSLAIFITMFSVILLFVYRVVFELAEPDFSQIF